MVFLFLLTVLISCSKPPSEIEAEEEFFIGLSPTATQEEIRPIESAATPTIFPTETSIEPPGTPEPAPQWDLSGVTLIEATHLMDPEYFQISMENWPGDLPEGVRVLVDMEEYNCDLLFPEEYPGRVYCWGLAPERGKSVFVSVFLPGDNEPAWLLPFVVPAPGGDE